MKFHLFSLTLILVLFTACGNDDSSNLPVDDEELPLEIDLSGCPLDIDDQSINILTWSIDGLDKATNTVEVMKELLTHYRPDIIALQDIRNNTGLFQIDREIRGWSSILLSYNDQRNSMLGFLYDNTKIRVNGLPIHMTTLVSEELSDEGFTPFRRPIKIEFTHIETGQVAELLNIHLKCCEGEEESRRVGGQLIKGYLDGSQSDKKLVLAGNFNDNLIGPNSVFQPFVDDTENYRIATKEIAQGPSNLWSFPSGPLQSDNFIITNELFDNQIEAGVLRIDDCYPEYFDVISNHRPVYISIKPN